MKKQLFVFGLAAMLSASGAEAATIVFDNTNPQNTTALTGFATSGDEMDGMALLVTYALGGDDAATWVDNGPGCGVAVGSNWSLEQCGDTFSSDWTLTAGAGAGIASLFIDAGVGGTVFDMTSPDPGTTGSASGLTFATSSTLGITVTFSGPVGVAGNPPVGDLYRYMLITFASPFEGELVFGQDADNLLIRGDITPSEVPEPASMLLLGGGLAAAAARRRRARRDV
jgi:hypothetical protein